MGSWSISLGSSVLADIPFLAFLAIHKKRKRCGQGRPSPCYPQIEVIYRPVARGGGGGGREINISPPVPMRTPARVSQSGSSRVQFCSVSDYLEFCVTDYCCSVSLCKCESAPPTCSLISQLPCLLDGS